MPHGVPHLVGASAVVPFQRRLGGVLEESAEPLRMRDIHAEVEALVGQPVSWSTIKNALSNGVRGNGARLIRPERGRYCLRADCTGSSIDAADGCQAS
jgi:hypothetical protein